MSGGAMLLEQKVWEENSFISATKGLPFASLFYGGFRGFYKEMRR